MELDKNKTSRAEQIILDYTSSSNWEQIKKMDWTTAEMMDVFDKHLPTLFKVATEDSTEVLEKPNPKDFLNPEIQGFHYSAVYSKHSSEYDKAPSISEDRLELNKLRVKYELLETKLENQKELTKIEYSLRKKRDVQLTETNKHIKDLELSLTNADEVTKHYDDTMDALRVENEKLKRTTEIHSRTGVLIDGENIDKLTEANKQLKEYKEVVENAYVTFDLALMHVEENKTLGRFDTDTFKADIIKMNHHYQALSKLNKD